MGNSTSRFANPHNSQKETGARVTPTTTTTHNHTTQTMSAPTSPPHQHAQEHKKPDLTDPLTGLPISKSEYKRRLKAAAKPAKTAAPHPASASTATATAKKEAAAKEEEEQEEIDPTQYFENRCRQITQMRTKGINPYPHKFHVEIGIVEYNEKYEGLKPGKSKRNNGNSTQIALESDI